MSGWRSPSFAAGVGSLFVLWGGQAEAQVCTEPAPGFVAYVARIEANRVLLAWGRTDGDQTIGYESPPHGKGEVWIDGALKATEASRNWVWVGGLEEDHSYDYTICLNGRLVRRAGVQTYPIEASRVTFFVIGDYGTGTLEQVSLAAAMVRTFRANEKGQNPVRFVLTTGDNIYRSGFLSSIRDSNSGASDKHWRDKFFGPYEDLIGSIPFLPSVGNHDRGETEKEEDLVQYYDNFLFPPESRVPYYTFIYGQLAQFFSINTASRSTSRSDKNGEFGPASAQRKWLENQLNGSSALWKIPYFHHPPFTAGPNHSDAESTERARHLMELFSRDSKVVFNGHEHNFQFSEASGTTRGTRYIVTGAGGKLDAGLRAALLPTAHIEQWASAHHFLQVDIDRETMTITVLGVNGEIVPKDRSGQERRLPIIGVK